MAPDPKLSTLEPVVDSDETLILDSTGELRNRERNCSENTTSQKFKSEESGIKEPFWWWCGVSY